MHGRICRLRFPQPGLECGVHPDRLFRRDGVAHPAVAGVGRWWNAFALSGCPYSTAATQDQLSVRLALHRAERLLPSLLERFSTTSPPNDLEAWGRAGPSYVVGASVHRQPHHPRQERPAPVGDLLDFGGMGPAIPLPSAADVGEARHTRSLAAPTRHTGIGCHSGDERPTWAAGGTPGRYGGCRRRQRSSRRRQRSRRRPNRPRPQHFGAAHALVK